MSLISARAALLRSSQVRKTLLLVTVVLALLAGLLAMHTISTTMGSHSQPEAAAMAMSAGTHVETGAHVGARSHVDSYSHDPVGAGECDGECGPGHDMAAMVCVLALLFTSLLLVLVQAGSGRRTLVSGRLTIVRTLRVTALRSFRDPPDLVKLSISRT
jgi:hypothetical protein